MKVNRKAEEIPASLEVIRRKAMMAIFAVERETEVFTRRYIHNASLSDQDDWNSFIEDLCSMDNRSFPQLEDFKDVDYLINKYKTDQKIGHHKHYHSVRSMCDRGKMFEYISFSLKNELQESYENNFKKYFLSFSPESDGLELKCVRNYENMIIEYDREIGEKFEELNTLLDEENSYEKPLSKYLGQHQEVLELMERICQQMLAICEPMKKWVMADASYARKIQDEINMYNKRKMDMKDFIKQLENQRDQGRLKLKRRYFKSGKLEKILADTRDEKRFYKRRENTVRENYLRLEQEIEQSRYQLDELHSRIKNRKENSFTVFNYLTSTAENVRDEIRVMEGKQETMRVQMDSLRRSQMQVQKELDRQTAELERMSKMQDAAERQAQQQDHDVQLVKADLKNLDKRTVTLKKIREYKLHSDTIKKIYHFGYHPGQLIEIKDDLTVVFQMTAGDVGKDWVWLYHKLPFRPPRDFATRSHDVEVIDLSNRRIEKGFGHLAIKGLEKWRRLSVCANVPELLKTLRTMKKGDLARRIQKQLKAR